MLAKPCRRGLMLNSVYHGRVPYYFQSKRNRHSLGLSIRNALLPRSMEVVERDVS